MIVRSPRVATIVLNYQAPDDTVRAVDSLRRSTVLDQQIVVVDNGPQCAAFEDLAQRVGAGIDCVASGGNLGYAAGNNVGIRSVLDGRPEFVWLLNPDTEVEPHTLEQLLRTAEAIPDTGTIGARILDPSRERILFDGGLVDRRHGAASHLNAGRRADRTPPGAPHEVDYVTGACVLIRRSVFDRVGLLPEDYFLYFEETAFCLAVAAAGWRNIVDSQAQIVHYKRSSGKLPTPYYLYYMTRNRLRFAQEFFDAEPDVVLPDLRATFLDPWRSRVIERAPAWLATFDTIVDTAVADARAGRTGPAEIVQTFPDPTRESAGADPAAPSKVESECTW